MKPWDSIIDYMVKTRFRRISLFVVIGLLLGGLGGLIVGLFFWFLSGRVEFFLIPLIAFSALGLGSMLYAGWPMISKFGKEIEMPAGDVPGPHG